MSKRNKKIDDLFEAKRRRRKELARLSIEEKVRILVELQKIAVAVFAERGLVKRPWKL